MKMAKKLLAVVLAGVLALSVLTGCGDAVSTKAIAEAMSDKTIAEAMSDASKDKGFVYEADPELNEKARQIAEMIRTKGKGNDSGKKTDIYGEIMRNIMSKVAKGKSPANVRSIGTVPITENGVDYLFAVITADAV